MTATVSEDRRYTVTVDETTYDVTVAIASGGGGGVTDHGDLTGLGDDDHTIYAKKASNLSDIANASTALSNLGGQPLDSDLTAIAALSPSNDDIIQRKAGEWTNRTIAQLLADLGLGSLYQPLDSDLTAIAALTTTAYGRAVLELANQAALMALLSAASESASGIVELATTTEATTGTDTVRAVTPAGVKAVADLKLSLAAGGASVENIGAIESNVNTVATSGATETLDTSLYAVHDVTMDQACTFTFSNPAASGKNTTFVLILRGAYTPTFPAAVDWPDASAPTYTTPSIFTFTTVDAGTTWLGARVGKAYG